MALPRWLAGLHDIDIMPLTLIGPIVFARSCNRLVLGRRAVFVEWTGTIASPDPA